MNTIGIRGFSDAAEIRAVTAIASCWNLRVEIGDNESADLQAMILRQGHKREVTDLFTRLPCLIFACCDDDCSLRDEGDKISFSRSDAIPTILQGKTLLTHEVTFSDRLRSLTTLDNVAIRGRGVIWKVAAHRKGKTFVVATPPPRLDREQRLSELLNGETFLHALPVWLFLKELANGTAWAAPPLRACLVVDDPNLHRPAYGHIDYGDLIEFAQSRPFHAAMATVPLDGWWTSPVAVRLFRENQVALSLLIHGNDHLHYELARPKSAEERFSLVSQSLTRTLAVERKTGLLVDRIMAPPHGVCPPEMINALLVHGYEGLTTNRWSLWNCYPPRSLPEDSGLRPADILGDGLPILSRFRFKSPICQNELLIAALFRQPIIPYGHHHDFSGGMVDVSTAVEAVNGLGPVDWMSMKRILETNFERRIEGETFRIRIFSRRVQGTMPPHTTHLQVELPASAARSNSTRIVEWAHEHSPHRILGEIEEPIPIPAGSAFEVRLVTPRPAYIDSGRAVRNRPSALMRRLVSEARDRLRF